MRHRLSALAVLCVLPALVTSAAVAWAEGSFRGVYQATATEQEGTAQVTLALRVFNEGSADLSATVSIVGRDDEAAVYAAFPLVFLAAGGSARVDGEFSVPLSEYREWQVGSPPVGGPQVQVEYRNGAGETVRERVWAAPGPVSPEDQDPQ